MKEIEVTIFVVPTPKGRPRVAVIGKHAHAYTPKKTRVAEADIKAAIRKEVMAQGSFDAGVALKLSATFYRDIPTSTPKRVTMPVKRPDVINYGVLLLDALQKYVYADDSQITTCTLKKRFGSPPRIDLRISEELE